MPGAQKKIDGSETYGAESKGKKLQLVKSQPFTVRNLCRAQRDCHVSLARDFLKDSNNVPDPKRGGAKTLGQVEPFNGKIPTPIVTNNQPNLPPRVTPTFDVPKQLGYLHTHERLPKN